MYAVALVEDVKLDVECDSWTLYRTIDGFFLLVFKSSYGFAGNW